MKVNRRVTFDEQTKTYIYGNYKDGHGSTISS